MPQLIEVVTVNVNHHFYMNPHFFFLPLTINYCGKIVALSRLRKKKDEEEEEYDYNK